MSLSLSEADLQKISEQLFLLKSPALTALPKPVNSTGSNSLSSKLDSIASNPRFKDIGIGVIDFTVSFATPKIWLHNEDKPWRVASTGKIAILLAAIQLREDVRQVKATDLISTPDQFDVLFSTIWKKSTNSKIRQILGKKSAPRISTIFDIKPSGEINFVGADTQLNRQSLSHIDHLSWANVPDYTFWERLWLTGAQSDNVAATTCVSEIGVAYLKAVQRAYGLFAPNNGMHLLLASGYAGVALTPVNRTNLSPLYRRLQNQETNQVTDIYEGKNFSTQPGSAAALTAYMIALMQDKLVNKDACDTIRTHLADEKDDTATSLILEGVENVASVTKAHTKLGILGSLRCEFAYLEADQLKYGVVATGILPKNVGSTRFDEEEQGKDLGKEIHNALKTP